MPLQSLDDGRAQQGVEGESLSKTVARAFTESSPLDDVLDTAGKISTKTIDREIKAYLGEELRRLAKVRGMKVDEICDVTGRAVLGWTKDK